MNKQPVFFLRSDSNNIPELESSDLDAVAAFGPLGAMLHWQDQLSALLGCYHFDRQTLIEQTLGQLIVEAGEALAPFLTKTKPWKQQTPELTAVDMEVIDILHYILTYFNVRGFSQDDIVKLYRQKNLLNYTRVQDKIASMS